MPIFLRAFARLVFLAGIACNAVTISQAQAQTSAEVARGLQWLSSQVRTDGGLINESQPIATSLQARAEAAHALKLLASTPPALADSIAAEADHNTEYACRQIIVLALAGNRAEY